jgi:phosphopantothenoylcysteine decarboxylase/phosphopantothenate--cysteine ligase
VGDFKPVNKLAQKYKKEFGIPEIALQKTKDILADMGASKKNQFLVGFALESNNEIENAKSKLLEKNLDLVVLNSLKDEGAGFETNTNKVTILSKDNNILRFELKSKHDVANDIANLILNEIDA